MMECFGGTGWAMGAGMGMGWIGMLLFWGLVIAGIVTLVRWAGARSGTGSGAQSGAPPPSSAAAPARTPLLILQERYARGEIERDEYEIKRRDLSGGAA